MAAFINAIAEEGTKNEAVEWLQKTWDELMDCKAENAKLREALEKIANGRPAVCSYGCSAIARAALQNGKKPDQFPDAGKMVPSVSAPQRGTLETWIDVQAPSPPQPEGGSVVERAASALIEEYRKIWPGKWPAKPEARRLAKAAIRELEAENAKLREALQSIVDYPDLAANAPHIARTALQKDQGE